MGNFIKIIIIIKRKTFKKSSRRNYQTYNLDSCGFKVAYYFIECFYNFYLYKNLFFCNNNQPFIFVGNINIFFVRINPKRIFGLDNPK